jgi:rod shape-determining protein MreC
LLEVTAFLLIVQNNKYQSASFLNSSNYVAGEVYSSVTSATQYLNLGVVNEQLANENAQYRNMMISSFVFYKDTSKTIIDTIRNQKYTFKQAKVINNSVNRQDNYITLNKGSLHGIKPDMAVITSNGIVGVVRAVSKNFSSVISVLNSNMRVSAKLRKSDYFGSLSWTGSDYRFATLSEVPTHVKIVKGDTIVTSGFSGIFPEDIPVGVVDKVELPEGSNFYEISVKLKTDFKNISYVYVVNNLLRKELTDIERIEKND